MAEEIYKKNVALWQKMRKTPTESGHHHVIHVEFGHFYDREHFKLFEKYAVRNTDSLGMNEAEVKALLELWYNNLGQKDKELRTP